MDVVSNIMLVWEQYADHVFKTEAAGNRDEVTEGIQLLLSRHVAADKVDEVATLLNLPPTVGLYYRGFLSYLRTEQGEKQSKNPPVEELKLILADLQQAQARVERLIENWEE